MEPFLGQLLLLPYNFAPVGWLLCQGQLLPIAQYDALFSLLGTTYGGDGQNTFALPDLRGRTPIGMGTGASGTPYIQGETGGSEQVTITANSTPLHTHVPGAAGVTGDGQHANGTLMGDGQTIYRTANPAAAMAANTLNIQGGSQPHNNLQPYLTLNWCIATEGIFPPS
jgi:microcystin-dependent protein